MPEVIARAALVLEQQRFPAIVGDNSEGGGIKEIVDFKTGPRGESIQVVRKVRMVKKPRIVNKLVVERKKWAKFGACANAEPGPEKGITEIGDEVKIETQEETAASVTSQSTNLEVKQSIKCRWCGKVGDHWSSKCPLRDKSGGELPPMEDDEEKELEAKSGSTYVVPGRRAGEKGRGGQMYRDDEDPTLRVTNLSENTTEKDLAALFQPFGQTSRIFLPKDHGTNLAKGYAYVSFRNREDAAKAIEALNRLGYDHLILSVEWADRLKNK